MIDGASRTHIYRETMRILSGKRLCAMMASLGLLQGAACSNSDNETPEASADAGSVSADTGSTSADSGSVTADTGSTSTDTGATSADTGSAAADTGSTIALFSFFVTSLAAMQELSGSPDGFGGDLRFGETGPGAGLRGADKICRAIAEKSMPGAAAKQWRRRFTGSWSGSGRGSRLSEAFSGLIRNWSSVIVASSNWRKTQQIRPGSRKPLCFWHCCLFPASGGG